MARNIFKSIFIVGSGSALAQIINVVSTPVITRLYSPDSYGEWALLLATAAIIADISVLRYELAVVLPTSEQDSFSVVGLCVLLALLATGIVAAVLPAAGQLWLGTAAHWAWAIPLFVFSPGIYQTGISWFTHQKEFVFFSLATLSLPLMINGTQITIAWLGFTDTAGLVWGSIIGQMVPAVAIIVAITYRNRHLVGKALAWRNIKQAMIRYKNYPLFMTPYTLTGVFKNRTAVYLLGAFGEKTEVGYYAFSERLIRLPGNFVSSAIRPVFFQKATEGNFRNLEPLLARALFFINKSTTPFFVFFLFQADDLFAFAFGEEWRHASRYAIILSFPAFVLIHTNWLDRGLDVMGRQKLAFQLESFFSIFSVCMLFAGLYIFGSVMEGIVLQASTLVIYNIVWLIVFFQVAGFRLMHLWKLFFFCLAFATCWTAGFHVLKLIFSKFVSEFVYFFLVGIWLFTNLRKEWDKLKEDVDELEKENQSLNASMA